MCSLLCKSYTEGQEDKEDTQAQRGQLMALCIEAIPRLKAVSAVAQSNETWIELLV